MPMNFNRGLPNKAASNQVKLPTHKIINVDQLE